MGYYNTFVVKIWCNDYGEMIRGYVQHVSSQEQSYFLNNESMNDFIMGHLAPPSDDTPTTDVHNSDRQPRRR